jgi:acetyl-CoA synthetase (ADP-forming)
MEIIEKAKAAGVRTLSEADSREVLAAYGIPLVPSLRAGSAAEAAAAAERLGYPVALKGTGAELAHKTEADVVRLDLRSGGEVERAYAEIKKRAGAKLQGVLVQRMIKSPREFVAGLKRDPQFGPCVMFGLGGVFTEALRDVTFRVAPLSAEDAQQMLDEFKGARLLSPYRKLPAADRAALARLLVDLGRLGMEQPEVAEVDINPILLDGEAGAPVAADALVVLKGSDPDT